MLGMTTIGRCSHVGSQALLEVQDCLVYVFFWQLFPYGLQTAGRLSTHQSSLASAGIYGTFPAWHPRCDSPADSNLESLGPLILLTESRDS